jgi:hypothetical protein
LNWANEIPFANNNIKSIGILIIVFDCGTTFRHKEERECTSVENDLPMLNKDTKARQI